MHTIPPNIEAEVVLANITASRLVVAAMQVKRVLPVQGIYS